MDAVQHRNDHVDSKQDSTIGKVERLEKMEAMKQLLESLVELSERNERVSMAENADQKKNYHRMIGLLKTITELQEKYRLETGLTNDEAVDLADNLIAG